MRPLRSARLPGFLCSSAFWLASCQTAPAGDFPDPGAASLPEASRAALQTGTIAPVDSEKELGPAGRPPKPTNQVDVLFVIDNSPSMTPKQMALGSHIKPFIQSLDALGLDYHVGIVSTDIGTQTAVGSPWGGNIGKCDTFEGDDGLLQVAPCTTKTDTTSDARRACAALCPDPKYVPTDGKRYISKVGSVTNVPAALVTDPMTGKTVDQGPQRAFQCMALLGDSGCGVEGQLESVRRALDGHLSGNSGFLRPQSLLAVVVLTDEDDCSIQMAKRSETNPATRDCDPTMPDSYDCYNVDYRCLARSIQCNESMLLTGSKTGCKERPANYLEPLSTYVSFLQGLRPANRLLVTGIWALPSIDKGGKVMIDRGIGGATTPFLNRAPGANAACVNPHDPLYFGQAQLRLSSFAARFSDAQQYSLCDVDSLDSAMITVAKKISDKAHH